MIGLQAEVNIGLLGHVDHGKTSLTQAITGKWTDTHSEELKRGISIRLGYADASIYYCKKCKSYSCSEKCACGSKTTLKRRVSFLDAPGHETLMATVLSASSIMDGAFLLIAANESCPQPQTEEHLMVLNILGIKNIVVIQTKIDLVSKEEALIHYKQIKEFLKGTIAENAPIVPVVANKSINISSVIEAMENFIPTPERDKDAPPLLYVSRSFDVNKPGTSIQKLKGGVFGGSLSSGTLKVGDEIEIRPGLEFNGKINPIVCKVSSLHCDGGPLKEAHPGGLIAVGTTIDPYFTKGDALMGTVIGAPKKLPDTTHILSISYNLIKRDFNNPYIKKGEVLVISVQTTTTIGTISESSKKELTIKLKRPVCVDTGSTVAISRRVSQRWRLSAWGTTK
ncbi:translation initiation factor IF-2 subunit gamma [Candidatus Micrarchaeota archaeon]|nr:translation initiation factor IF-2 subunit gamma [Candidatus Micrarchaeota archaeon]